MLTLSAKESLILELLIQDKELYGLELVAASRRRLKRGTVYVTLGRMEDKAPTAPADRATLARPSCRHSNQGAALTPSPNGDFSRHSQHLAVWRQVRPPRRRLPRSRH